MKPSARVRNRTRQAKGCLKRSFRETDPATGLAAGLGQQRRPWRADGLDIEATADRLKSEWPLIRDQILLGADRPMPVRWVMIPEPEGGARAWRPDGEGSTDAPGPASGSATDTGPPVQRAQLGRFPTFWNRPETSENAPVLILDHVATLLAEPVWSQRGLGVPSGPKRAGRHSCGSVLRAVGPTDRGGH